MKGSRTKYSSGFDPKTIPGCSLWLDAADRTTLSFSGSNVTQWRDKSGTGNHYATGGAITHSNNALVFPGNATLSNTNPINFSAGTTPSMSTFVVVSTPDGSQERGIFQYGQISCSKTGYAIYVFSPSEVHCTLYCGDLMVRNAITTNTRMMVADVVTYSGTPGSLSRAGWINGAAMTTTNVTTTGVNLNLASSSVIGNVAGGFWNGTMNEILYFNRALSTAERQEIEGYLAAKWNLPVRVPTTHPFRNVLPSTPLFSPPQLSGLVLWLDPTDSTTLTLSGTNITQWADKSGNSNTAVAGTTTYPVYTQNGLNGAPIVRLQGANDYFLVANNFTTTTYPSITYFIVINPAASQPNGTYAGILSTDTAGAYGRTLGFGSGSWQQEYYSNFTNITPYTSNVWSFVSLGFVGTSSATLHLNGVAYAATASGTGTNTTGFKIGSYNDTGGYGTYNANFDCAEILVYGTSLTTAQRQQVEGYLAWKWGLQARLPSTHPFAKFRP